MMHSLNHGALGQVFQRMDSFYLQESSMIHSLNQGALVVKFKQEFSISLVIFFFSFSSLLKPSQSRILISFKSEFNSPKTKI